MYIFMTKSNFSRKEARMLERFAKFGISKLSLKPEQVFNLGAVLSRAHHVISEKLEM